MIVPAIKEALQGRYPPDSALGGSCKRRDAVQRVVDQVGEQVYWIRRSEPPPEKGQLAIVLTTLELLPNYFVNAEDSLVQPVVQISVFGTGIPPKWVFDIVTDCRLALSNYRGDLWTPEQERVYVHGATITREQADVANISIIGGGYWSFASGFDLQVSYDRAVLAEGE